MARQQTTGRERRRNANERYRQGFLVQASAELHELASLLTEEPDATESVAFELRRLGETAESLDLGTVARAAADAADELSRSDVGVRALRRVGNAIRHAGGRLRFGPLVVIGVAGPIAEALLLHAELCCEPVRLYSDLQAFAADLHTEQPTAVVLPVDAIDAIAQLVSRESFPVIAHGSAAAWEARAAAMSAGAHGFLIQPFALSDVTRVARWRSQPAEEVFEVLLMSDPEPARDVLARSMEQLGMQVVVASEPSELAVALEAGTPRAVVLAARVAGVSALSLSQLVRSHPRCNHLPILVSGRPEDPAALRAIGVDDVMRTDAQPLQAAQRVRDRVVRMQSLPLERDPVSGMQNRLGILDRLDDEIAQASRTREVLSVALLELDGLRAAVEVFGAIALQNARRLLCRLLEEQLRRTDQYGELGLGEVLITLPGCGRAVAVERLGRVAERFVSEAKRDGQLKAIAFVIGAADSEGGLRTVGERAERDLRSGGTARDK